VKTLLSENFLKNIYKKIGGAEKFQGKSLLSKNINRQPVHVVYGGADKFKFDISAKFGRIALKTLDEYADNDKVFFDALGLTDYEFSKVIYKRVIDKLKREPVEDYRIDFEDGYGIRTDSEEDKSAELTALETSKGISEKSLPPFFGIRIKPLTNDFKERAIRTLDIYLSTLISETKGKLPDNFLVTLPKITFTKQITILVELLKKLEDKNSLPEGSLKFEMMIETPEVIINQRGECGLPALISASEGRCFAAHFGAYDFTSSLDITAKNQSLDHPLCDFAKNIMKVAFADSGIFLSDGATNILPVPRFRNDPGIVGTNEEKKTNREVIFNAWKISFKDIRHSLQSGFYEGWDLHPAQIPIRYAAVYSFFLEELESATKRLKSFIDTAAQVSLSGNIFDDAASAQGLLNFFIRSLNCGALIEEEVKQTGLTIEELRTKSFLKILESRN
jgi:citrate lyase beta subunit